MSAIEALARGLRDLDEEAAQACGRTFTGWADLDEEARDEYRKRAEELLRTAGRPV